MGSRYEVEITVTSAKDLKNVNWRHGPIKPYAVVWVDPAAKSSTRSDDEGDTSPFWDETLLIPFSSPIEDSTLHIDIVHAGAHDDDTKPLIGSARLRLSDVVNDAGLGRSIDRKLKLKRPCGRPQGKLEVQVSVRESRYREPEPYGVPSPTSRVSDYPAAPPPYGNPYGYGAPPESAYAAPPTEYHYVGAPGAAYGQVSYGQPAYESEEKKKSKFGGMGTGLAVGEVAGLLGGVALAEGAEYVEDEIAVEAAEEVEDKAGYDW